MRMKSIFLATSAIAILAAASQSQASNLYVSVFGGANMLEDTNGAFVRCCPDSGQFASDADTGFVLGGAIGTHLDKWAKGLKVELEASYRRNDVGGTWQTTPGATTHGIIEGNMSTFAILANAWYEFDIGTKVRPYVGGGVGWARSKQDSVFLVTHNDGGDTLYVTTSDSEAGSGFAWQLGLGINYQVAPDVDLGIGYRHFNAPKADVFFNGKNKFENANDSVQVNLTIGIN